MSQEATLENFTINVIKKRPSIRSLNEVGRFRYMNMESIRKCETLKYAQIARALSLRTLEYKIKMLAVSVVVTQLLNDMDFLRTNYVRQVKEFPSLNCSEKIFSWSYDDWLITLPNRLLWFSMLEHQMPPELFGKWLTVKNFRAIENGFKLIRDAYMTQTETALEALAPMVKFHNMEDDGTVELKEGVKIIDDASKKLLTLKIIKKTWTSLRIKSKDKFYIANIENKYLLDYSKVREEEVEYRNQLAEKRLFAEIQSYNKRISTERLASSCTRDAYFNEIETLRDRIDNMTKRYDSEYNRLESGISHLKASIEKLHTNRICLLENIAWFKKERDSYGNINRQSKIQHSRKRLLKGFTSESPNQENKRLASVISNRSDKTKVKRNTNIKLAENQK